MTDTTARRPMPAEGTGIGGPLTPAEIRERCGLVRALKEKVGGRALTGAELDRIIPAVDRKAYRGSGKGGRGR